MQSELAEILHEIVDVIHGARTADPGTMADLHAAIDKALPDDKRRAAPPTADTHRRQAPDGAAGA
jgi:hypothetical protein